jgi:hypothetical protein
MSLASEDKQQLRDIIRLLTEIRDLLKSPPVTIEQRPAACTCGEAGDRRCPVHSY